MQRAAQHAFKTIESHIKDGSLFRARAVLLFGEEGYLADHYERVLRERYVTPGAEVVDCSLLEWDAKDVAGGVSDIMAACDTLPMMSERRVVSVSVSPGDEKSLGQSDVKRLAEYAASIPETTLLVIKSGAFPKNSALYKTMAGRGAAYEFGRLDRGDLSAFVRGRFRKAGVGAPPEVISEIIKVSGYLDREPRGDLFTIGSDVANVAAYALGGQEAAGVGSGASPSRTDARGSDGLPDPLGATGASSDRSGGASANRTALPVVSLSDVAACLGTSMETDVFAMLDAVSAGRKGDSLELLRNITSRGSNAFGLLALLTGQFEIMLGYRELRDRGVSLDEIARTLGIKSMFRLKKAAGFADRYSAGRIAELLHRLYRVDRDIKSGLYGERLALTMFIAEM
jgi:DNA polymerase-3 subunit delta